jgi:hypothetical protein
MRNNLEEQFSGKGSEAVSHWLGAWRLVSCGVHTGTGSRHGIGLMSGRPRPSRELGSPLLANAAAHFSETLRMGLVSLEAELSKEKTFAQNGDRHFAEVRRLGSVLRGKSLQ